MIVVADSSPLVALVNINQIEILPRLFGAVLTPPAVVSELLSSRRPVTVQAFAATPPAWLEIRAPQTVEAIPGLHSGEQAALALALETKADLILIDETLGRRIAGERHLRVAGTVGVLERAAAQSLLDLRAAFESLKKTDFWVTPALLDARLKAFEQEQARERGPNPGRGR
jgi:predicted nucleic acid-binding protein